MSPTTSSNEAGAPILGCHGGDGNDTLRRPWRRRRSVRRRRRRPASRRRRQRRTLQGGVGNDLLDGGAGDDFMDAQPGDDVMIGGGGQRHRRLQRRARGIHLGRAVAGGWQVATQQSNSAPTTASTSSPMTSSSSSTTTTTPSDAIILPVPCFLAGTLIATPSGERAIETLRVGDLVLTADGRAVPILFAGRTTVEARSARGAQGLPILIQRRRAGRWRAARATCRPPRSTASWWTACWWPPRRW